MMRLAVLTLAALLAAPALAVAPVAIVVHGGAGSWQRGALAPEEEDAARSDLAAARDRAHELLVAGGSALEAVVLAVRLLEDSPHFNAGRGAVLNAEGEHELDAAVMDGASGRAGAVAALKGVRNPVLAALAVMERSAHVLLVGPGAEAFARAQGLEPAGPEWFRTERRIRAYEQARERARAAGGGTVGAVARDRAGRLAAATSTGGMTLKLPGRVGDAPLIGAGTWADRDCAVSATGHGEYFIRATAARVICLRRAWRGEDLREAAEAVLAEIRALGGEGGVIALDREGRIAAPFTSAGMARAWRGPEGEFLGLFAEESAGP